jgi:2-alkyl-3-oxoalkanoate reductase
MRILLAGGSGAIGRRLIPMLLRSGHEVLASTRTPEKTQLLRQIGAEPVLLEALNRESVFETLAVAAPHTVIDMLTALPRRPHPRRMQRDLAVNDRLRDDGTRDLVAASQRAGVTRVIAQSVAFLYMPLAGVAGRPELRTEQDPLDFEAPKQLMRSVNALHSLEHTVRCAEGIEGVVLRFGHLYGPGTAFAGDGAIVEQVRRRKLPIFGGGEAVWSFVHIDDAARAVLDALHGRPGVYNVVDEEPSPVRKWLPELARAAGAPPPRHMPALLGRALAGAYRTSLMKRGDGACNELAKRELGWKPQIASWRQGFYTNLG